MSRILVWHDKRMIHTNNSQEFLKKHFPNETIVVTNDRDVVLQNIADTEILVSVPYDKEVLEKGKNIKWIQALGAGYNHYDISYLKSRNIKLSRIVGAHNTHLSEFAIMAMIMLVREMGTMAQAQQNHHWQFELHQDRVYGKTLIVIGCGAIGMDIARYAKMMGMHVIGIVDSIDPKNATKDSDILGEIYTSKEIDDLLPKADIVLTMLPSTPETYHFMSYERFKKMKSTAFFINLGRGDAVESSVIYDVLSQNIIKGAFFDVFEQEPLPSDHPIWTLKNIIITPHSAGYYHHYLANTFECFHKNYCFYEKGEELLTRVDNLS